MRAVKGRDTGPERVVRRLLHAMGYRFRVQVRDLPGRPDIAWKGRRKVVFVHGCFWHGHDCRRGSRKPVANAAFWAAKIERNRARDLANEARLTAAGWATLAVWECELKDRATLAARLQAFLGPTARGKATLPL